MNFLENIINEFKDFALNSKSLDIAIGMLLGAGIKPVANSMVDDFVMPVMGLMGKTEDLKNKYVLLRSGESGIRKYKTIKEAKEDGAIVISYGNFISALLNFVVLSGSAYAFVKVANSLKNKKIEIPDISLGGLGQYQTFPEIMKSPDQPNFKPRIYRNAAPMYDIHNQYYAHDKSTGSFAANAFPGWEDFSYDSRYWRSEGLGYTKRAPSAQVHFPLAYRIEQDPSIVKQLRWTE